MNAIIRWLFGMLLILASFAVFADTGIQPPGAGDWIVDEADLISGADQTRIAELSSALDREFGRPLQVVTVESMAAHGSRDVTIERFARKLYEEWGDRSDFAHAATWRRGILLLVSKGDRKARIELGADWGGQFDSQCRQIMDWAIIPNFKRGDFSGGIVAGVTALDRMARDAAAPPPAPMTVSPPADPASDTPGPLPAEMPLSPTSPQPAPHNPAPVPASMPRPMPAPSHPMNHPGFQSHGGGMGGNTGSVFLLFFFLVPVIAVLKMITGGRGGTIPHSRFDSHSFHGDGPRSFRRHGGSSFGIGAHDSHSGFHSGGHSHSHGHSGGGGGASGSW